MISGALLHLRRGAAKGLSGRDPNRYWDSSNPVGSTKVAGAGVRLTVTSTSGHGESMTVSVVNPAP